MMPSRLDDNALSKKTYGLNVELLKNGAGFLQNELGVSTRTMQDENVISAIADPKEFMKNRSGYIKGLFENVKYDDATKTWVPSGGLGPISEYFNSMLKAYTGLGMPAELARSYAVASANRMYLEELAILEKMVPGGYQTAFGTASLQHNTMINKSDLANARDEWKREYKAKKFKKKLAKRKRMEVK